MRISARSIGSPSTASTAKPALTPARSAAEPLRTAVMTAAPLETPATRSACVGTSLGDTSVWVPRWACASYNSPRVRSSTLT